MQDESTRPVWIRGPQLRKRWGSGPDKPMSNSTFYDRIKKGLIPAPKYPFGPGTPPHWDFKEVEAAERQAVLAPAPPKRKPRNRKCQPVNAPAAAQPAKAASVPCPAADSPASKRGTRSASVSSEATT